MDIIVIILGVWNLIVTVVAIKLAWHVSSAVFDLKDEVQKGISNRQLRAHIYEVQEELTNNLEEHCSVYNKALLDALMRKQ